MSKYSGLLYGQSYYGQKSRLAFSVEPFSAVAVNYTTIQLAWSAPVGGYTAFRVVRNQEGYPETVEDGAVIYEEFGIDDTTGSVAISTFSDGVDNPNSPVLVGGKFAYYRVWLLKSADKVWYPAGETVILLPSAHPTYGPNKQVLLTTHDKFMNLLPRVFTSASQSPIDEVSADSDLYRFLQGFSFTVDEFLSMTDSLLPDYSERKTSPAIIGIKADQLGLTREPTVSIKNQKRMLSQALYLYSHKGTLNGVSALVESLTGYFAEVSVSPNLMLTNADSTFNGGIGFWLPIGNCTISLEDVNPVTSESLSIDRTYSAKVIVGTANALISNGNDYPVTRGIPVTAGTEYTYSFYVQKDTGTGDATPSIHWYDYKGVLVSSDTGSAHSSSTTWSKGSVTATAPTGAVYASIDLAFGSTGTYYVDMFQVAESTTTDFNEARATYIFLYPKKNNFILNPSFEVNTASWSATSGTITRVSTDVPNYDLTGSHALQLASGTVSILGQTAAGVTATDNYQTFSIFARSTAPTEALTLSIYVHSTSSITAVQVDSNVATFSISATNELAIGDTIVISGLGAPFDGSHVITGFDGTNVQVALTTADQSLTTVSGNLVKTISQTAEVNITDTWARVQTNIYIPATFETARTSVEVGISGVLSDTVQLDAAQLEQSYLATDYFDGDYGTERDALWAGTPNASNSYLYPNKLVNVSRLAFEIGNFLPQDTPYIISSYSGTEASGFTD